MSGKREKSEYKVLSPTAILGYGFPEESFENGMAREPDLIAVDGGSTDPGPYYLGAGKSFTDKEAVRRDISFMLPAAVKAGIPFIVGTAGGCGAKVHVEWQLDIIREVSKEKGLSFKMGIIYADIKKGIVQQALKGGKIASLDGAPELTENDIDSTVRIVAQMGAEPVADAIDKGCDVIIAGRCYDPVSFAAPAVKLGFDPGLAYHMGKILECAAIAADPPGGSDCVLGILEENRFILEALNIDRKFTRTSSAAHTLYEKSDPYTLPGPDGILELRDTVFEELGDGRVAVSGSRFVPSEKKCVKLEGVKKIGFRTISIAGARDPKFIEQVASINEHIKDIVRDQAGDDHELIFRLYGKNGVMADMEPLKNAISHELGIIIEAVAPSQDKADSVCSIARSTLMHYGYPGRISTAGNLAFPYSPSDISCGEVYGFSIYHLMESERAGELFPLVIEEIG